jgi:hypothetical protein
MKYLITLITCITISMAADGTIGGITYFDYTNSDEKSAFNFNRQYFSYAVDMSDDIKFKFISDVGRSWSGTESRLNMFLKKAQIDYKTSFGKVSMGLIGTNTYGVQEKNWGYRFIEQSAIDKKKFSSTADLGIGFSRSLIDNLNMSLQVVNGEGFKQPQLDKYHKISLNTTYGERRLNKNDGYNTGIVYSTEATDGDPTNMISAFGGFAGMGLRIGAEYDMLTIGSTESSIISVSANYSFMDNKDIFLRYDMYDGDTSVDKDGSNYIITGILLSCGNGLSVAPNMRIKSYEDDSKESITEYKVNFQFRF